MMVEISYPFAVEKTFVPFLVEEILSIDCTFALWVFTYFMHLASGDLFTLWKLEVPFCLGDLVDLMALILEMGNLFLDLFS